MKTTAAKPEVTLRLTVLVKKLNAIIADLLFIYDLNLGYAALRLTTRKWAGPCVADAAGLISSASCNLNGPASS
jgi:hypothetical protein